MVEDVTAAQLVERLESHLAPASLAALRACERLCRERGVSLYLVGGAVRDLLLGRETIDLDLAVEADVALIAQALAAQTEGSAVVHQRFGTASVRGAGFRLDLARTRRESYARPGALPSVAPATIVEDMARRDFTINALALRLAPAPADLVDPYRGLADLRDGLVRVLHERSFQDDATRMLRSVRYAARLGFEVSRQTEALIRRHLRYLDAISGPRLRRELSLLFEEPGAVDGAETAERLGLLEAIHPALRLDSRKAERWRQALAGERFAPLDELGFCFLIDPRTDADVDSVSARLHLAGRVQRALRDLVRLRAASAKLTPARPSPAAIVELLDGRAASAVWALAFLDAAQVNEACLSYLREWRRVRPHLRGGELLALGVAPGAAVGEALRKLRRARLEGRVKTRADEVELVRRELV